MIAEEAERILRELDQSPGRCWIQGQMSTYLRDISRHIKKRAPDRNIELREFFPSADQAVFIDCRYNQPPSEEIKAIAKQRDLLAQRGQIEGLPL